MSAPATLHDVRAEAGHSYPLESLVGCETALMLYAAGFYGRQDCIFVADAGLRATCVDLDAERLETMKQLYPDSWEFVTMDALAYACTWRAAHRKWDVVSVDPPSSQFDVVANRLEWLCDVARYSVIIGTGLGLEHQLSIPNGWALKETIRRSDYLGGVFWSVLERSW